MKNALWVCVRLFVMVAMMSYVPASLAAELSAQEQAVLKAVQGALKNFETNLKLAEDAAGPGTDQPPPAKARLAAARLSSAKSAAPSISEHLGKLPADNADVQSAQTQFDGLMKRADALEARITGKASGGSSDKPQDKPADQPAPPGNAGAAQGVKLDYKQEEALKNARYHSRDAEGRANAVAEFVKKIATIEDQNTIDHRLAAQAMNTITDARGRLKNAHDHLDPLPRDGKGVAEVAQGLKDTAASLDESEKTVKPLNEKLTKLVDPANFPNFKTDLDRLRELAQMYGDPTMFQSNRPAAGERIAQASAVSEEAQRVLALYAPLIQQQTEQGKQFEGAGKHFLEKYTAFGDAAMQQKQNLPGEIKNDFAEVSKMADHAVQEKKPAYFNPDGGVPQQLRFIEEKVALYAALDPDNAEAAQKELAAFREQMKSRAAALREEIIANNPLPPDRYQGEDRKTLEELAMEAWKKEQPDAQILAYRIPSQNWQRETMWRYHNKTWTKIDHSKVQVQLLVKQDDKLTYMRPINLVKDHLKNDQVNAYPMAGANEEVPPQWIVMIEKIK